MKELKETAKFLKKQYKETPQVGIVLGSGLGNFINEIEVEKEVAYGDIPNFPVSTVEGHKGKLIFGKLSGKTVVAMAGRFHYYEGYGAEDVVFPIRVMKLLGIETLLLSNAAGGVNPSYKVGDIMIIKDHISQFTPNPLIGRNIAEFGPRFSRVFARQTPHPVPWLSRVNQHRRHFLYRHSDHSAVPLANRRSTPAIA